MIERQTKRRGLAGMTRAAVLKLCAVLLLMSATPAQAFGPYDPWIDIYKLPLFSLEEVNESSDRRWSAQRQVITGKFGALDVAIVVRKHACTDAPCDLESVRGIANAPMEPDSAELQQRELADRVIIEEGLQDLCRTVTVGLRDADGSGNFPVTVKTTVCGAATEAVTAYIHGVALATQASNKEDLAMSERNGISLAAFPTEPLEAAAVWLDVDSIAGFELHRVGRLVGQGNHVFDDWQVIVGKTPDHEIAMLVFLNPCKLKNGESDRGSACSPPHNGRGGIDRGAAGPTGR